MKKKEFLELIKNILRENNILNMRGVKGYGVGHPYPVKTPKQILGTIEDYNKSSNKKKKDKKIKISRAFLKGKN